jgi:HEPN domain-containing protein
MKEKVKELILKAKDDLATSEFNYEGAKYSASVLYAQKAVKKGLIALITKKRKDYSGLDDFTKLEKILLLYPRITKLYTFIDLTHVDNAFHDTDIFISKEYAEEIIKAAQEVLIWVDKRM